MLPGEGQWLLFMEEYWPWVGGICKCLGANARGFPGVNSSWTRLLDSKTLIQNTVLFHKPK